MTNLLINEQPLQVLPSLATKIGLNQAIFLQQLHWWLGHSRHVHKGKKWVYNTKKEWAQQFPFWSEKTLERVIKDLKDGEWILTDNFNVLSFDRTLWYTVNYQKLREIEDGALGQNDLMETPNQSNSTDNMTVPNRQNDLMGEDNMTVSQEDNLGVTIPKDNHKNTQKKTTKEKKKMPPSFPKDIISYFNEKTGKNFSYKTKGTVDLISGRFNDGYTLEQFKQVIDIKTEEWLHNSKMNQHLAPTTLFRPSNFEKYLNQNSVGQAPTETETNGSAQPMLPEVENAIREAIGDEAYERLHGNRPQQPNEPTSQVTSQEIQNALNSVLNKVSRR